jgi:cytidine deaminase
MAKPTTGNAGRRGAGRTRAAPAEAESRDADLMRAARAVRRYAHAPFSGFKVGAALETGTGDIVTGCNIENASYGLTMCAERVAMFKALAEGHRRFRRVVVATDTTAPTPPCGACRQILWEFGGDLEVILVNRRRALGRWRLRDLLPLPFDASLFDVK